MLCVPPHPSVTLPSLPCHTFSQALYGIDPQLNEHRDHLEYRWNQYQTVKANIEKAHGSLEEFAKVWGK